jgi:hypothetical protein
MRVRVTICYDLSDFKRCRGSDQRNSVGLELELESELESGMG